MALALRHAFSRAFIFLLVVVIDPLGSASWGDRRSHEIWQTFYAPHYGAGAAAETARNAITVVTYDGSDQVTMARPGQLNPIHFLEMIRVIRNGGAGGATQDGKPDAVFVDLLMDSWAPDEKTSVDALLADAQMYRAKCPAALREDGSYPDIGSLSPFRCLLRGIADLNGYDLWKNDRSCLTSELAKLMCIQRSDKTAKHPHVPPILIASPIDPASRFAQHETPAALALRTVAVSVPALVDTQYYALNTVRGAEPDQRELNLSPAAMLYAAYCAKDAKRCDVLPYADPDPEAGLKRSDWLSGWGWSARFAPAMDVTWGIGTKDPRFNEAASVGAPERDCDVADTGNQALLLTSFRTLFMGVRAAPARAPCLYQHHIPYRNLRFGQAATIPQATLWNDILAGKLVLIGLNAPDSNDFVPAGPHGQLPGIYYHAMALDNLIKQGSNYARKPRPLIGNMSDQDLTNSLAVLFMSLGGGIVIARDQMRAHRPPARRDRPTWRRLAIGAAVSMAFGLAWSCLCLLVISPGRFFGLYQFNLAALSIVILIEMLIIVWTALKPILERLVEHSVFFRLLFGDIPVLPARSGRRKPARNDDQPVTDASRGGADYGPAGGATTDL